MAGTSLGAKLFAGILLLGGTIALVSTCVGPAEPPPKAASQNPPPTKDDVMYGRLQRAWIAVQAEAKAPSSLEFVAAGYTDEGAVAIDFRGRNSFNAVVPGRAVLSPDGKLAAGSDADVAAAWNRHIARKPLHPLPRP